MAQSDSDRPTALFPKLSGQAPNIAPDEIARHQRARIMRAMVEAIDRNGYEKTTVSDVVALAGVSKSAFYNLFENKEACYLETYDAVVDLGSQQIGDAYRSGEDFREGMEAAFQKLVDTVEEQQAAARLVLVESFSLSTRALESRQRASERYEEMIRQSFEAVPLPGEVSAVTIRAVFGGLRDFARHCLRDDEVDRLGRHVSDLVEWGVGYRIAAAERRSVGERLVNAIADVPGLESRRAEEAGEGEAALSWEEPAGSSRSRKRLTQRERILRATAQIAARDGYDALRVSAISAEAGTSNQTFYQHFGSKEKAFLAAFDSLAMQAFEVTASAFAAKDNWLEAGALALRSMLEFIREDALFRQINFFELYAAGPIARDRAEALLSLFVSFMQPDPVPPDVKSTPPKVVVEAIAGGLWAVIQHESVEDRSDSLPDLLPEILDMILLPFGVE